MSDPSDWFVIRRVRPGVWLIAEPGHVCCWLVEGSQRAILVDSGLGVAPLRPVVEVLTRRPVTVVNTHYHFDHVGGNHEFEDIAIHRAGAPRLGETLSDGAAEAYMRTARCVVARGMLYSALDAAAPGLLMRENMPRPLPTGFTPSRWTTRPSSATRRLEEGDEIDLGGRKLVVLHTPGHSPDGIALWDEPNGLLFAGDVLSYGHIYAHFADSDVAQYAETLARLEGHPAADSLFLLGHCERPVADGELLADTRSSLEQATGRACRTTTVFDVVGNRVLLVRGSSVGVTVPIPGGRVVPLNTTPEKSKRLARAGWSK